MIQQQTKTSDQTPKDTKANRYTATIYLIERNGTEHVYYQRNCRFKWYGYLCCLIMSLDLADLVNEEVVQILTELKPIV